MYPYPGYCGTGLTELTEYPGTGMKVIWNLQKFRTGMKLLQSFQNFRVLKHGRTEVPKVPGSLPYPYPGSLCTGVQNFQKFRVRV